MTKAKTATRSSRKQYASLKPRVKTLKEATIRKKWKKLPVLTQAKVADLLRTVERPALTHGSNDKRTVEVQAAIVGLVEELIQRLPRMPFPPGTDESSFDFESTLNRQRVLEERLTANTYTIALLSAEVGGETELLEQEKGALDALETDLADLERSDGKQEKRLHPCARASGLDNVRLRPAEYEASSAIRIPATTLSNLEHDPEAKDVLVQLRHHLDSMQNNVEATKDIAATLATSQAALDVFNWKQLGTAEYRCVYGVDAT